MGTDSTQTTQRSKELLKSYMMQAMNNLSASIDTNGLNLQVLNTAVVQFFNSLLPLPDGVACKKSCAFCCYLNVGVSIPEAVVIFDLLSSTATEQGLAYFRTKILNYNSNTHAPCPFLDADGQNTCLIYEIRPFSCRAYHSTDVDICHNGFDTDTKIQIPCFPLYRSFTDMYSTVFIQTMAQKGLPSFQVSFIKALQILFEKNNATELWLAGDDIFRSAILN